MTDRELLELAAKAVGIGHIGYVEGPQCVGMRVGKGYVWNPLTDDGDAFRLMVDCGLDAGSCGDLVWADPWKDDEPEFPTELAAGDGESKLAVTRRAIVRAAAALGEKK